MEKAYWRSIRLVFAGDAKRVEVSFKFGLIPLGLVELLADDGRRDKKTTTRLVYNLITTLHLILL
jgi:hypothetical protein